MGTYYSSEKIIYGENGITLTVDVPGFTKQTIDLKVEDGILSLKGDNEGRKLSKQWRINDREKFDMENISASVKDGVLTVVLPLSESGKPIKIKVE